MQLHEPLLYAPAGDGDGAVLLAMRDPASGALAFPRTAYGIGAAAVTEEVVLSGRGTVLVCITVHQPLSPGMATPLLVARIQLEEGLVVDGILQGTEEAAPGTRVRAVLAPEERNGATALACRFRVAEGAP